MPLYKTIQKSCGTKVLVWKIEESFENLYDTISLKEESLQRIHSMKSEIHRRGFLSIRKLLEQVGYSDFDLHYTKNGKPFLEDGNFISISHSFHFSAIIVGNKPVGIDIEKNRTKIGKIAPKFVENNIDFKQLSVIELTVLWGAKESLYKIYPEGGLLFKEHIPIQFPFKNQTTSGRIVHKDWNKEFQIFFEPVENFTLVFAF